MSPLAEPTVLIVDPLPLRNLGLASVLDRLSPARKFRLASLSPDNAEEFIGASGKCSMIIYNVGGDSVGDHKHLKRIKMLRAHTKDMPLVIFSDRNDRKEVLSALNAGAQGFLYAGTNIHLAQQALSFILEGGSYFPSAAQLDHRQHNDSDSTDHGLPTGCAATEGAQGEAMGGTSTNVDLTHRQKAVLERLGRGDSNKAIARRLGIREGTVKVHVRQIMRKLGVANRTQVAIACAGAEPRSGNGQAKSELSSSDRPCGLPPGCVEEPLAGAIKRLAS